MAMRTPRATGTAPSRPYQATLRPVYEDFKPLSEWKEGGAADTLLVYLPGFMREQMKVSTERQNTVRVRGERLVGPNKWSRFQEDFRIPENCNMGGIHAKFEGGTLTITMPRKSIIQFSPKAEEAKTTLEAPTPQEATSKQTPQKGPQEDIQAKADLNAENAKQRDAKNVRPFSPQKTAGEPPMPHKAQYDSTPPKVSPIIKPQKGPQEDVQAKADLNAKIVRPSSPPKPKTAGEPMYQKVEDGSTTPKATPIIGGGKQTDGRSSLASPSPQEARRGQDQTPLKAISGTESKIPEKAMGNTIKKEKGSGEKSKESVKNENFHAKFAGKGKEEDYSNAAKAKKSTDVTAGDSGYNKLDSYMEAVKGLTKGLTEERQLMVNMGVAALVLVALGAYITYSYGSSGKPKN